jgi:hypothetical protein
MSKYNCPNFKNKNNSANLLPNVFTVRIKAVGLAWLRLSKIECASKEIIYKAGRSHLIFTNFGIHFQN